MPTNSEAGPVDVAAMNRAIQPGDDFYRFTNGRWLDSHEIPADAAADGTGRAVFDETQRRIADLIKTAQTAEAGTEARKIGDFYASFMDEAAITARGNAPIVERLKAVDKIRSADALAKALGAMTRTDVDVLDNTTLTTPNLFGLWIAQDLDEPTTYAAFVLQGGLGMGNPGMYVGDGPEVVKMRDAYKAHVQKLFELVGAKPAAAEVKAKLVLELETLIAKTHASTVDTMDVHKGNNHWTRVELLKKAPGLDWKAFLEAAGLGKQERFVIWHPGAIVKISALVTSQPVETWKAWLGAHTIDKWSQYLGTALATEHFAFHGTVMSGAEKQRDRWKRGVDATSTMLAEPVGKLYVAKYFPPEAKARAKQMVANELAAFARRIDALTWMTPATKEKAKAKLAALHVGVGYPDKWHDYASLDVKADDLVGNVDRAEMFDYRRNLAKLGTTVDRDEWKLSPQTVDAQNYPAMLAMAFPAAILQPPFFDPNRPAAMDYGAAGAVIGHEISHTFDDMGADFDATGRIANWWTPEDYAHFKQTGALLVAQYDAYKPLPDLSVNGKQTLSENIADTAGLAVAYDAYHMSLGDKGQGKDVPRAQGFTPDQQLFISFAQMWRAKMREPLLRRVVMGDVHSPAEFRGQTVRNIDAWYSAFGVKAGHKLYLAPDKRAHVW